MKNAEIMPIRPGIDENAINIRGFSLKMEPIAKVMMKFDNC